MKSAVLTFVDCTTITSNSPLPEFIREGAELQVTTKFGSARVKVSARGQSPRQAYAKGFGRVLQGLLPDCSKSNPVEAQVELVD